MENNKKMRTNQVQIYRLFPEDTAPTLIVYSHLIASSGKPILKYPKYAIWERVVVVPIANFDSRLKSLQDLITNAENENPPKRESGPTGYDQIEDANSENYVDVNQLSDSDIERMRKEL